MASPLWLAIFVPHIVRRSSAAPARTLRRARYSVRFTETGPAAMTQGTQGSYEKNRPRLPHLTSPSAGRLPPSWSRAAPPPRYLDPLGDNTPSCRSGGRRVARAHAVAVQRAAREAESSRRAAFPRRHVPSRYTRHAGNPPLSVNGSTPAPRKRTRTSRSPARASPMPHRYPSVQRLARESEPPGKDTILFDQKLPGFGLRIHPSGQKVWIVQTRIEGRGRRIVIARYGEMKLAEARRRARETLHRIRTGGNPADDIQKEKRTPTLREFTREYLRRSEPKWKPSGRETVRIYLNARILPTVGLLKNPIFVRGAPDVRRRRWFGSQFGVCGRDGRRVGPSRRLGMPGWRPGWQEERRQAA